MRLWFKLIGCMVIAFLNIALHIWTCLFVQFCFSSFPFFFFLDQSLTFSFSFVALFAMLHGIEILILPFLILLLPPQDTCFRYSAYTTDDVGLFPPL